MKPHAVYSSIYRSETWKQLEHVFSAVSSILDRWCEFGKLKNSKDESPRKRIYGRCDNGCLTPIEFDKLINVICRIWAEMFKSRGPKDISGVNSLEQAELDKVVRFRPPTEEVPGKHGPGMARLIPESEDPRYVTQMLIRLSIEEEIPYITLSKNGDSRKSGGPRGLSPKRPTTTVEVNEYKDYVIPGIAALDQARFWRGFTVAERSLIASLSDAIKHLGPSEIRALGTHKSQNETVKEVRREIIWAIKVIEEMVCDLNSSSVIAIDVAQRFRSFSDEAARKAYKNRAEYEQAHVIMLRELGDSYIKQAFF